MGKVFRLFERKKNDTHESVVELVIYAPIYEKLKKRARREGISENEELLRALKRGMSDYWLHVLKHERARAQWIEELFDQAKQDNELLEALIDQNILFQEILEGKAESR